MSCDSIDAYSDPWSRHCRWVDLEPGMERGVLRALAGDPGCPCLDYHAQLYWGQGDSGSQIWLCAEPTKHKLLSAVTAIVNGIEQLHSPALAPVCLIGPMARLYLQLAYQLVAIDPSDPIGSSASPQPQLGAAVWLLLHFGKTDTLLTILRPPPTQPAELAWVWHSLRAVARDIVRFVLKYRLLDDTATGNDLASPALQRWANVVCACTRLTGLLRWGEHLGLDDNDALLLHDRVNAGCRRGWLLDICEPKQLQHVMLLTDDWWERANRLRVPVQACEAAVTTCDVEKIAWCALLTALLKWHRRHQPRTKTVNAPPPVPSEVQLRQAVRRFFDHGDPTWLADSPVVRVHAGDAPWLHIAAAF